MATLAEEIQIRIDIYGGREQTARIIKREWRQIPEFFFRQGSGGNRTSPMWSKEERQILQEGIAEIALKINKSRDAVRAKMYSDGII